MSYIKCHCCNKKAVYTFNPVIDVGSPPYCIKHKEKMIVNYMRLFSDIKEERRFAVNFFKPKQKFRRYK